MHRTTISGENQKFRLLPIVGALLAVSILLSACDTPRGFTLPTLAARAQSPDVPNAESWSLSVPATYTPGAPLWVTAGVTTSEPTPFSTPTLWTTYTPSPVPVVPAHYRPSDIGAPYLDSPPESVPCVGEGYYFRSRFPSEVGGQWREYHVYLPPCYGHDGRVYPVVYLIHGSIQTDSHWLDLGLAQIIDEGIASGKYPPFIAIMPYSGELGNSTSGGDRSIEGITVNQLMPFIERYYCTWNEREGRSIGGISRGGYWALEIAFKHPDLFSAVAGHSSHLRYETDSAKYNPLSTYASVDLSNMRIWLDRGEEDFLRAGQDTLHNNLSADRIRHEYHINPGGHSDAYWLEHLREYIDWHVEEWSTERDGYPWCNPVGEEG
ncbi:MAG: alpha/beta hydrolase [Candidatus Promineifilaceae bacterium]